MLSREAIDEFKGIYRQEYGQELPDTEAVKMATEFITFFKAIYRPIPKDEYENKQTL